MKTVRRWHVLVLLALIIDLVNPVMPGVFSLVQATLFMDGVTRAHVSLAGPCWIRECLRMRTSADAPSAEVARGVHVAVRDARRAHEQPDPRRALSVSAGSPSADADDQ
jgi:hypothetical protein